MNQGTNFTHSIQGQAYLLVSEGQVQVDKINASKGDGLAITKQKSVDLKALQDSDVLIIEVPGITRAR